MRSFMALIMAASLLTACGGDDSDKDLIRPVRVLELRAQSLSDGRVFSGVTKAGVEARLSFRVAGIIEALPVKVGNRVRAGDIIAKLDPNDYELQLQQAEAALLQAEAQERRAAANYTRIRDLYETESASRADLDAARAEAESAKAMLQATAKKRDLARSQLSYTVLKAPLDGGIASVSVEVNENVASGHPIVLLTSSTNLEVHISIPEVLIAQIHEGDRVEVRFDAHSDNSHYPAVVTEVGVASRSGTTFPVTVQLLQRVPDIRSGMAAEVFFGLGSDSSARVLYVPSLALLEEQGERYVFVVHPDANGLATVRRVEVKVGELTNRGIIITDGLLEGDVIVTAGVQFLRDGQRVRVNK